MDHQIKKKSSYIVGLGEALWDILPNGKKLGGAPANFAYHATRLGYKAIAVSAVGHDRLGDETLAAFDAKGVKYMMPRVPYATGTVQVTLDAQGIPAYDIKENVAWDNIPFTEEIEDIAKNCCAVCWGTLAQRSIVSQTTIHRFLDAMWEMPKPLKIFDINLRQHFYSKEIIEESLRCCNILKINDEELAILASMFNYPEVNTKEACHRILKEYGLDVLVLTCGVHGSYVFTPDIVSFLDTPHVKVIDTVGAGDSFTGAFCVGLLRGMKIEEAHKMAVKVSAYVCTQKGAMPELPENFIKF